MNTIPDDTLDRLLIGKATEGDQMLAYNALAHPPTAATRPFCEEIGKDGKPTGYFLHGQRCATAAQPEPLAVQFRIERFAESDPVAYVKIRGPVNEHGESEWQRKAELYDHMQEVAQAAGFGSITEAIATQPEQVREALAWYDPQVTDDDKGLSWTPGQFHTEPLFSVNLASLLVETLPYVEYSIARSWNGSDPCHGLKERITRATAALRRPQA